MTDHLPPERLDELDAIIAKADGSIPDDSKLGFRMAFNHFLPIEFTWGDVRALVARCRAGIEARAGCREGVRLAAEVTAGTVNASLMFLALDKEADKYKADNARLAGEVERLKASQSILSTIVNDLAADRDRLRAELAEAKQRLALCVECGGMLSANFLRFTEADNTDRLAEEWLVSALRIFRESDEFLKSANAIPLATPADPATPVTDKSSWPDVVCRKCGIHCRVNRSKYCGDGSDKDNHHVWAEPADRIAAPSPEVTRE